MKECLPASFRNEWNIRHGLNTTFKTIRFPIWQNFRFQPFPIVYTRIENVMVSAVETVVHTCKQVFPFSCLFKPPTRKPAFKLLNSIICRFALELRSRNIVIFRKNCRFSARRNVQISHHFSYSSCLFV